MRLTRLSKATTALMLLMMLVYFRTCHRDKDYFVIENLQENKEHLIDIWYNFFLWDQPVVIEVSSSLHQSTTFVLMQVTYQIEEKYDTLFTTYELPKGQTNNRIYIKGYGGSYTIKYLTEGSRTRLLGNTEKIEFNAKSRHYTPQEERLRPALLAKSQRYIKG